MLKTWKQSPEPNSFLIREISSLISSCLHWTKAGARLHWSYHWPHTFCPSYAITSNPSPCPCDDSSLDLCHDP